MDANAPSDRQSVSHEVMEPSFQTLPLVFASPHSGRDYSAEFLAISRLDPLNLRRSEDSFVDELFQSAPAHGAPLLRALFPRAYVDPNREPFELDPAMFMDTLPDYANTRSPRVAAGLGTIARVVASGADIYAKKLPFQEALTRIHNCYWPYHTALRDLVERTRETFGFCILIDCHSMPSVGGPMERDHGQERVDFVLGDCYGVACAPTVIDTVESSLRRLGHRVGRNKPYSGGYVTRHYGRPSEGVHCLQIEICRGLYMDERRVERGAGLQSLELDMRRVIESLADITAGQLAA